MKIGILTFHRAHNYGAVLQAYAMKYIFSQYGQTELIDYWPDYHRYDYELFDLRFLDKGIPAKARLLYFRSSIKRLILLPLRLIRHYKFKKFINTNFLSSNRKTVKLDSDIPSDYDVYVFGSDQIWRVYNMINYPCPDLVYLGSSVPKAKKKIAYAASMGEVKFETLQDSQVKLLLSEFSSLGVREKYLKQAIETHCSLPATQVLDPTMLVPRDEWARLADMSLFEYNQPYLLLYNLIESPISRRVANKIANELGIRILEINGFESIKGLFNTSLDQTAGPNDFLHMVRNARFVVSTSFHCIVFSILFRKNFYACGMGMHSGRVESLLDMLDLRERFILDEAQSTSTAIINFEQVDDILISLVGESALFVRNAIS